MILGVVVVFPVVVTFRVDSPGEQLQALTSARR